MTKIYPGTVREVGAWAAGRDTVRVSTTPPPGARVLIIEDETTLAGMIAAYVSRAGYDSSVVHTGPDGVQAARDLAPDVVILDLGLPGLDGIEVCRQLRTFTDCYVIVVTARKDEIDTLIGLSVGADDYITKPFSVRELVARVGVLLRRPRGASTQVAATLRLGDLTVDTHAREVRLADSQIQLTRTEFDLLATFLGQPRRAFDRRALIEAVWGVDWVGDEHLVDTHIAHLRRKLGDDASNPRFIETVRGVGYRAGSGS